METEDAPRSKPKRGQPVHSVWGFAFDNPNAHCKTSPNNVVCKHCKQIVRHHHKTKSVKAHLKKCKLFKKIMLDTAVSDRPDWWAKLMNVAKKSTNSTFSSSSSSGSTLQPSMRSFAIPVFSPSEQKKFNHDIAMFFYCSGTIFQRVENTFLSLCYSKWHAQVQKLPTCKQLGRRFCWGTPPRVL